MFARSAFVSTLAGAYLPHPTMRPYLMADPALQMQNVFWLLWSKQNVKHKRQAYPAFHAWRFTIERGTFDCGDE